MIGTGADSTYRMLVTNAARACLDTARSTKAQTIVNLCCGYGIESLLLLTKLRDCRVYGLDVDRAALKRLEAAAAAQSVADRLTVRYANLDSGIPTDIPQADLLMSVFALHYLKDTKASSTRWTAMAAPGATLFSVDWWPKRVPGLESRKQEAAALCPQMGPEWTLVATASLTGAGHGVPEISDPVRAVARTWHLER